MIIDSYIAYIRDVRRYSARTQDIYAASLEQFRNFVEASSDEELTASLTPSLIRSYEVMLMDSMGNSPRTVNLHLSVLSGFCRWLLAAGLLKSNPVKLVSRPKQPGRLPDFYRREALEKYLERTAAYGSEETLQLITGTDEVSRGVYEHRLRRLIVVLLYSTGIRRSELISLTVGSVDMGRGVMHVRGKGDKMREIPLLPSLCEEISLYSRSRVLLTGRERTAGEPLLQTFKGGKLYPVFVDRAVKEELGQEEMITGRKSPHVLRHTLATELLDEGSDLNSIKELLGHSSLAATQVYTHNSVEKLKSVYMNAHPRAKNGGKNGD